jgi:hypothetical protein
MNLSDNRCNKTMNAPLGCVEAASRRPGAITVCNVTIILGGVHLGQWHASLFEELAIMPVRLDASDTSVGLQNYARRLYWACQRDLVAAARITNGNPVTAITRCLLSRTET